jgi:hypothetical protein
MEINMTSDEQMRALAVDCAKPCGMESVEQGFRVAHPEDIAKAMLAFAEASHQQRDKDVAELVAYAECEHAVWLNHSHVKDVLQAHGYKSGPYQDFLIGLRRAALAKFTPKERTDV